MAELNVTKKSISSLFSEMQGTKFIIPDYQRPYKWDLEKCEIVALTTKLRMLRGYLWKWFFMARFKKKHVTTIK